MTTISRNQPTTPRNNHHHHPWDSWTRASSWIPSGTPAGTVATAAGRQARPRPNSSCRKSSGTNGADNTTQTHQETDRWFVRPAESFGAHFRAVDVPHLPLSQPSWCSVCINVQHETTGFQFLIVQPDDLGRCSQQMMACPSRLNLTCIPVVTRLTLQTALQCTATGWKPRETRTRPRKLHCISGWFNGG